MNTTSRHQAPPVFRLLSVITGAVLVAGLSVGAAGGSAEASSPTAFATAATTAAPAIASQFVTKKQALSRKAAKRKAAKRRAAKRRAAARSYAAGVPGTPTVTARTDRSISLKWGAAGRATGYDIYQGGNYKGSSATNRYTATGLSPATSYYFQIVSTWKGGYSAKSGGVTAKTSAAAAPVPTPTPVITSPAPVPTTPTPTPDPTTPTPTPDPTTPTPTPDPTTPTPDPTTPTPTPTPSGSLPTGNLPGWTSIYGEDFLTDAPLGSFLSTYSNSVGAYPYPWTDTSRNVRSTPGYYHPEKTLSVANGVMDAYLHYDATLGRYLVAAPTPKLPTMKFGRFAMKLRADKIAGYKIAPLLWPDSEKWPGDGEIDFPEGDLTGGNLSAFSHYANASGGQDWFDTQVKHTDWHVYETAWSPTKVQFFVDGNLVGTSTTNVPQNAMHWVLQFETQISSSTPSISAAGHVQVDWVKAYSYTPGS
ncbi:MAG: family 16 glycosylhydrolase [Candidatus Nanopelagicales bacterium]|nr:family 16 glycosylhydrolase [Candidatus Nanopelagicales bacterium]